MRRIACLDLDAFFVEVALKDHPELRGVPLVVGGSDNGRGVVCSASYEARAFGIRSGMPVWQATRRYQDLKILPVPGSIGEFSDRVRERLQKICPVVDSASIDEFFLDFTGCDRIYPSNLRLADLIWYSIASDPALPSTIGFGSNRLIAKVASDMAKPRGFLEVFPGSEASFLSTLQLKRIPGIGPKTEEVLKNFGLTRVGDILKIPPEMWRKILGRTGEALYYHALGISETPILEDEKKRHQKQLSHDQTLYRNTDRGEELLARLSRLTEKAVHDMRSKGLSCDEVGIKIRYEDFLTVTRSRKIPRTMKDGPIFETAAGLFTENRVKSLSVRLLGVHLGNLKPGACTGELWEILEPEARRRLPAIVDEIREKFGFKSILRARSILPENRNGGRH